MVLLCVMGRHGQVGSQAETESFPATVSESVWRLGGRERERDGLVNSEIKCDVAQSLTGTSTKYNVQPSKDKNKTTLAHLL